MVSAVTAAGAILVGASIGLFGIGGIFLIPLLVAAEGLPIHQAIGTALVTFVCTGLIGAVLYTLHGKVDWRMALLTSGSSLICGPIGAKVSVSLPEPAVKGIFAAFLLFVGLHTLVGAWTSRRDSLPDRPAADFPTSLLLGGGAVVGFGSGLTGVGGPAILVPLLVFLGLPVQVAVGISQVNSIAASGSGAIGHLVFGEVDLRLAAVVSVFEIIGVYLGAQISRLVSSQRLKPLVAALCIAVAVWTIMGLIPAF